MVRKDTRGLTLAVGQVSDAPPVKRALRRAPEAGIVARLLRALGWPGPAVAPATAPVATIADESDAQPVYEKHFASENEAVEYVREMTAHGYRAQAQYDPYDYSWSVEVHATAAGPHRDG